MTDLGSLPQVVLPSLIIIVIVGIGYYVNRDRLFEIARAVQSQAAFSPHVALRPRSAIALMPGDESTGSTDSKQERFEGAALNDAIAELTSYAKNFEPDWILGVHPGGRLLSVLIADRIGVPGHRCRFVRTTSHISKQIVLEPVTQFSNMPLEGKLLVIDDISRSGDTLNLVKTFLFQKNFAEFRFDDINFAVLLVVSEDNEFDTRFRPDFVSYRATNKNIKLPWSELSDSIGTAHAERRHKGESISKEVKAILENYDRIISDYSYALALARRYMASAISS